MDIKEIITFVKNDEISKQDLIKWLEVRSLNEEVSNRRRFIKNLNAKNIKIIFDNKCESIGFTIEHPSMVTIDYDSIDKIKSYKYDEYYNFINHIKFTDGKY